MIAKHLYSLPIVLVFLLSITVSDGQSPADDFKKDEFHSTVRKALAARINSPPGQSAEVPSQPVPSTSSGKTYGKLFSLPKLNAKAKSRSLEPAAAVGRTQNHPRVTSAEDEEKIVSQLAFDIYNKDKEIPSRIENLENAGKQFETVKKSKLKKMEKNNKKILKKKQKEMDQSSDEFDGVELVEEPKKKSKTSESIKKKWQKVFSRQKLNSETDTDDLETIRSRLEKLEGTSKQFQRVGSSMKERSAGTGKNLVQN